MPLSFTVLYTVKEPDIDICGDNCGKGERNSYFEEILVFDLIALFSENSDARDICGCSDRSAVSAEGCA